MSNDFPFVNGQIYVDPTVDFVLRVVSVEGLFT